MSRNIRRANATDAMQLIEIYRPAIEASNTSFELEVPAADEFANRIKNALARHEWLVMEDGDQILGYAYAGAHRARAAYQYSVETSVYVHRDFRGQKVGKNLYVELLSKLKAMQFHNAYAGITLPNDASVRLHETLGFEAIGVFREVGFKNGQWHDVSWWQRPLA